MKTYLRKKKYMLLCVLLFFSVNLYVLFCISMLRKHADLIAQCYPAGTVQASVLEQFESDQEEENEAIFSGIALWKILDRNTIRAGQNGRERKVCCYQIKGPTDTVFGTELILGRYFLDEEKNVCLIDQKTARQLFGSDQVLEMEIQIEEKPYRIIGILSGDQPVCAISSGKETDRSGNTSDQNSSAAGYDGVAVRKISIEQSSDVVYSRIEAMFGNTEGQKIDGQLYYVTACFLYFGGLALLLLLTGIMVGKRRKKKGWMLVCLAAGVFLFGIRYASPGSDYLPTFWSDFGFFSRLFQEKSEQIGMLAAYQEFSLWQDIFRTWRQAVVAVLISGLLFVYAISYCYKRIADKSRFELTKSIT